jgi:hypothetical protein
LKEDDDIARDDLMDGTDDNTKILHASHDFCAGTLPCIASFSLLLYVKKER